MALIEQEQSETERLPSLDLVGESGDWKLEDPTRVTIVTGDLIGFASSRRPGQHSHAARVIPQRGVRCQACRWFEITIIDRGADVDPGRYVMMRKGPTVVRGETPLYLPLVMADNAQALIDSLWESDSSTGTPFMSRVSRTVLDMAAEYDDDIDALYEGTRRPVKPVERL